MGLATADRKAKIEKIKEVLQAEECDEIVLDEFINKLRGIFPDNQPKRFLDYLETIAFQGQIKIEKENNKIIKNATQESNSEQSD